MTAYAPSAPTSLADPKIVADSVSRVFASPDGNPVEALAAFDLTVADGEFVSIVGPSGCGKSTFLRLVAGLTAPTDGTVTLELDGGAVPTAMVFQDHGIFPWKTVEANVRFALRVAGFDRAEASARTADWLERMQLTNFAGAYPATLSGGMRQRVGIARALALSPEILLMDEPFAALDAQLRQVLQEELLSIWQTDRRTVLFVTHSLEEAILLGDRVAVMSARPGRLLEIVDVPFDRPRHPSIRTTAEFNELQSRLWGLLRDEIGPTGASGDG